MAAMLRRHHSRRRNALSMLAHRTVHNGANVHSEWVRDGTKLRVEARETSLRSSAAIRIGPNTSVATCPAATSVICSSFARSPARSASSPVRNRSQPRPPRPRAGRDAAPEQTPTLRTASGPYGNTKRGAAPLHTPPAIRAIASRSTAAPTNVPASPSAIPRTSPNASRVRARARARRRGRRCCRAARACRAAGDTRRARRRCRAGA